MSISLKVADHFLSRFNYDLVTLQVFPSTTNNWPTIPGERLCTGEKGSSVTTFTGTINKKTLKKDLLLLQRQKMGVYFMVNEGDGERHGYETSRNSKSIIRLTSLFIDTDDGDPKVLNKYLRSLNLKPHLIVESSPKKYHYYFLLSESSYTEEDRSKWEACQTKLSSIDSFDQSMSDVSRVLRIPGFYHTKSTPFLTKIIYESTHKKYDLHSFYECIDGESVKERVLTKFTRPETKISLGQRHQELTRYLGSISNTTRDKDILIDAGIGFALRSFNNSQEWLPTGSRYSELESQVDYVISERKKEELDITLSELPSTNGHHPSFKKLPDSFYFNAPGIVGKMVKEICHYSSQPYPSFAFAASCSLIGTLKAPFIRGEYRDTPPSTYFLCLTEAGRGKDFPRAVIERTFIKLGFSSLVTQRFRSSQGFLKRLAKGNGIQLILHDEAHHLFAQIKKSDTDYITQLKPHLLSLFSSTGSPIYDAGSVVTEKIDIPPIPYPCINYCGFGLPGGFEDTFQSSELVEGLLPRFLVIRDHQDVIPVSRENNRVPKKFKFEAELRELSSQLRLSMETVILTEEGKDNVRKFVKIPMDDDAFTLFEDYSKRIAASRNSAGSGGVEILQSRLVEHVGRLAVMLSDSRTTKQIVQFCITFVDHCYENMVGHVKDFGKGQGNKDLDDLVSFISSRMRISEGPMLAHDFRFFRIRDRFSLENTLQLAIKLGMVIQTENYRKPGSTHGRKGTVYSVVSTIDQ